MLTKSAACHFYIHNLIIYVILNRRICISIEASRRQFGPKTFQLRRPIRIAPYSKLLQVFLWNFATWLIPFLSKHSLFFVENLFFRKTIPKEWNVGTACPGAKTTKHETASDESLSAWSGEHLFSAWFQFFACFQTCAICQCRLCEGRCQYHTWKMQRLQNSSIFQLWPIPQLVTMPNNATHMLLRIFPNETIGAQSSKTPHSAQIS